MILVERILGHQSSVEWRNVLDESDTDNLILEPWEIGKSRLKKQTENGRDIAVALDREFSLRHGDVLYHSPDENVLIVAKLMLGNVMVIDLKSSLKHYLDSQVLAKRCLELGHGLGNQHWPMVVKNEYIFVPLMVDQKMMESVMKTHGFDTMDYYFVDGDDISHQLTATEMRLLFASHDHTHHG